MAYILYSPFLVIWTTALYMTSQHPTIQTDIHTLVVLLIIACLSGAMTLKPVASAGVVYRELHHCPPSSSVPDTATDATETF